MPSKEAQEKRNQIRKEMQVLGELRRIDESLVALKTAFEALREQGDLTDDDIDVILEEFEKFAHGKVTELDKVRNDLRNLYERYYQKYLARAIVSVKNGVCQGCFVTIPPMRLDIIRRMDSLEVCENCGRILVWEEDEE